MTNDDKCETFCVMCLGTNVIIVGRCRLWVCGVGWCLLLDFYFLFHFLKCNKKLLK
jgi:hypothetical protein